MPVFCKVRGHNIPLRFRLEPRGRVETYLDQDVHLCCDVCSKLEPYTVALQREEALPSSWTVVAIWHAPSTTAVEFQLRCYCSHECRHGLSTEDDS